MHALLVVRGGSRGGVSGVATPPPKWSQSYLYYDSTAWCAGALIYIAKSMVVSLVCSEQVVKPHSRRAVVKPEVLHLECLLLVQYRAAKSN